MGEKPSVPDPTGEYAQWYIKRRSRELIRILGLPLGDAEDVCQHLTLELLRQVHRYDPKRAAPNTYTVRVVDTAAGMLRRRHRRLKRGAGQVTHSSDVPATGSDDAPTVAGFLTVRDLERRTLTKSLDPFESFEITEAIAVALSRMPPQARDVSQRLMAGHKAAAIARDLQISRRQVRNLQAIAGRYLENTGLKKI